MPSPDDPKQEKKVTAGDTEYKLADSDDETDDTVETRRSVKWAENELKRRWFINAGEKRSYEEKFAAGKIRSEVADFKSEDGSDPQASNEELADKEAAKKAALLKAAAEKREAEIDRLAEAKEAELRAKMTTR